MARTLLFAFKGEADSFEAAARGVRSSLAEMSTIFLGIQKAAAIAFDAAKSGIETLGGAVTGAVGAYADFDKINRLVASALGKTAAEVGAIAEGFTQIGIETEFTTAEIQKAGLALARMGTTDQELIPLLSAISKVASVTGTDLVTAARTARAAMNTFGLTVADTTAVQTLLIQATTGSAADIVALGEGLKKAGAPAKLFGQQLADIVPALQVLAEGGQEASTAGRAIRDAFADLVNPSKKTLDALMELKLATADGILPEIDPRKTGFIEIFENMTKAGLDGSNAAKIFGSEFGFVLATLSTFEKNGKTGAEVMRAFKASLQDTAAVAQKVATAQSGLAYELESISGSIDAAKVKLGEFITKGLDLSGVFARIREEIGDVVAALNQMTAAEFKDMTVRVFSAENLSAVFKTAVDNLLPALGEGVVSVFALAARTVVKFMPLAAAALGKTAVDFIGKGMISVWEAGGRILIDTIKSGMLLGIEALVAALRPVVAVVSDSAAEGLSNIAREAQAMLVKGAEKLHSARAEVAQESKAAFQSLVVDQIVIDTKQLLKAGEGMASSAFGDAGTMADVAAAGRNVVNVMAQVAAEQKARLEEEKRAQAAALADQARLAEEAARRQAAAEMAAAEEVKRQQLAAARAQLVAAEQSAEAARVAQEGILAELRAGILSKTISLESTQKRLPLEEDRIARGSPLAAPAAVVEAMRADVPRLTEQLRVLGEQLAGTQAALDRLAATESERERAVTVFDNSVNTNFRVGTPEEAASSAAGVAVTGGGSSSGNEAR